VAERSLSRRRRSSAASSPIVGGRQRRERRRRLRHQRLASAFPPELRDRATSLESELGRASIADRSLAETLRRALAALRDLVAGRFDAILDAWRALRRRVGARVAWTTIAGTRSRHHRRHRRARRAARARRTIGGADHPAAR
jgi:hypothetical protein